MIPSRATSSRRSDGSTSRKMTERPPRDMAHSAHPEPPMWNSGIATRLTVSSPMTKVCPASPIAVARLAFVSMTPLGSPVVPEVYSCMLTSRRRSDVSRVRRVAPGEPFVEGHRARVRRRSLSENDDATNARELASGLAQRGHVVDVDHEHGRRRVVDDGHHLLGRQTPVDGHVDGADQRAAEEHVEVRHRRCGRGRRSGPPRRGRPSGMRWRLDTPGRYSSLHVRRSSPHTSISWSGRLRARCLINPATV